MSSLDSNVSANLPDLHERLNAAQRLALDSAVKRILIMGSAGTGKSLVIETRVKQLTKAGVRPEKILWLTGRRQIGSDPYQPPDGAQLCVPSTLQDYCTRLIMLEPALFNPDGFETITPFEHTQVLAELIDTFSTGHQLRRNREDVYAAMKPLKTFFSLVKSSGKHPGNLIQKLSETPGLIGMPVADPFLKKNQDAPMPPGYISEQENGLELEILLCELKNYQELLEKRKKFDGDDLLLQVKKIFGEQHSALYQWQLRYSHILIDGLEQMNGSEIELLQLLISPASQQIVASVDDSYLLPGEPAARFMRAFSQIAKVFKLAHSYRPFSSICDSLAAAENFEGVEASTDKSVNPYKAGKTGPAPTPSIHNYASPQAEITGVASEIQYLVATGVLPENIAVIFPGDEMKRQFLRLVPSEKLAGTLPRDEELLDQRIVKRLLRVLKYLSKERMHPSSGDEFLFELLHDELFNIPLADLYYLTREAASRKKAGAQYSLRKNLVEQSSRPPQDLFDPGLHPTLKKAADFLEHLVSAASAGSLSQLFDALLQAPIVDAYLQKKAVGDRPVIERFTRFIDEAIRRDTAPDLQAFLQVIGLMTKEKISSSTQPTSDSLSGVQVLTAEQAAGSSFEYVFVPGLTAAAWENKQQDGFKDFIGPTGTQYLFRSDASPLRQLYTTLTRSNRVLTMSYASQDASGKPLLPSFIIPFLETVGITIQRKTDTEGAPAKPRQFPPAIPVLNDALEKVAISKFMMSASALNTWLDCPLGFYYRYILRVPSCGNEATAFGSAVHHALEQFFRNMQEGRVEKFPGVDFLLQAFETYMMLQQDQFTPGAFARRMTYGNEVLRNYHAHYHHQWRTIVSVELNITGVTVNDIPLKGKIDKLEFDGRKLNVVDYKSGDLHKAMSKLQPPNDLKPNGGDYWRQAIFYKILVDNYSRKDWVVSSVEIDFIEPGKNNDYYKHLILPTLADVETVKQQITLAWSGIQQGQFPGCGKEHCHWCSLLSK